MNKYSFLIAFFFFSTSFSQSYKGSIDVVKEDGLHKIMLTPEVRSASNENFGFLRVKDSQKNEVPYVLIYDNDRTFSTFKSIEIASKKVIKDSVTSIHFKNETRKRQDYIILKIGNTKIIKNYSVYGSDNGIDWFGLVANKRLSYFNVASKESSGEVFLEKVISFPLNTYQFLRINFNDENSLPIHVLGAGIYESKLFKQEPIELKDYKYEVISVKKRKVTQLKFTATNTHRINIVSFKINTDFFLRNARVIVKKKRKVKKRIETYDQVISRIQLNSKGNNIFSFSNLNEKEFIIEIENKDNPPLVIENIELLQKPVYLISNLKKEKRYEIFIDSTLSKPSYDLGNFISDKTSAVKETSISSFEKIKKEEIKTKEKPFWETAIFMWICIVVAGAFIVYFALGLLKDIGNQ